MKKLIPTICMSLLGLSVVATSSYAWFSMNKTVTATGMQVKARAEGGIQIKRYVDSAVDAETPTVATTPVSVAQSLLPTSTADAVNWYHNEGTDDSTGTASSTYEKLTITDVAPTESTVGQGKVAGNVYYVYDKYTVVADANSGGFDDLWLSSVVVSAGESESISTLAKSLRVLVKAGSSVVVAAPVSGATASYNVNGTISVSAVDYSASGTTAQAKASNNTLSSSNVSSLDVSVYVYYEGEDASSITNNLAAATESITISCSFKTTHVTAK